MCRFKFDSTEPTQNMALAGEWSSAIDDSVERHVCKTCIVLDIHRGVSVFHKQLFAFSLASCPPFPTQPQHHLLSSCDLYHRRCGLDTNVLPSFRTVDLFFTFLEDFPATS